MKLVGRALALVLLAAFGCAAQAVCTLPLCTVFATNVVDASGNPENGTIDFQPVDNNGNLIPFRTSTGQVLPSITSATITNGAFSMHLADSTQTTPLNVCYRGWVTDNAGRVVVGSNSHNTGAALQCVQMSTNWCSASSCDFDTYNTSTTPLPVENPSGAVTSVFGRTGDVTARSGDYTAAEVTNAVDQTGSYSNPAWITGLAWSKLLSVPLQGTDSHLLTAGTISGTSALLCSDANGGATTVGCPSGGGGAVSSVFGRTGVITAQNGDYTLNQVLGAIRVVSANDTASNADFLILANAASGAITETLPASPTDREILNVKKTDSSANTVTVSGGSKNIDGFGTSVTLTVPYSNMQLVYDATSGQWYVL